MRYVKSNIVSNFSGANRTKDYKTLRDLFIDQTSEVIAHNKPELIYALRNNNIDVSSNPTYRELVNKVVNNLDANQGFRIDLAKLMVKNQQTTSSFDGRNNLYSNNTGANCGIPPLPPCPPTSSGGGSSPSVTVGANPVSAIAGALGSIFSFVSTKKQADLEKERTKQSLYNVLAAKLGGKTGGLSTGAWIGISVLAIAAIGTVIYFVTRKKS